MADKLPNCQLCGVRPVNEEHATETQRRWKALTHSPAEAASPAALDVERVIRVAIDYFLPFTERSFAATESQQTIDARQRASIAIRARLAKQDGTGEARA